MKSSKQSISIKTRITSGIIGALFVLCAVFSFVFALPKTQVSADESTLPPVATENGIRFTQVAAGYDFAIGLTYDGKLYGWSLDGNKKSKGDQSTSLGQYYTETPREIEVTFSTNTGTEIEDKIKKIAATGTTAAFLTDQGYIYTWGYDIGKENVFYESNEREPHYLLLRNSISDTKNTSNIPEIIDYNYYATEGTDAALNLLIPNKGETSSITVKDIAASEYNYTVLFGNNSGVYHYTWGSLLYGISNIPSVDAYNSLSDDTGADLYNDTTNNAYMKGGLRRYVTKVYDSDISNFKGSLAAGGYNVAVNNSGLYLRGRNFLTSGAVSGSDSAITVTPIVNVSTSSTAVYRHVKETGQKYTIENAIMGGKSGQEQTTGYIGASDGNEEGVSVPFNLNEYYGLLSLSSNSFKSNSIVDIYGAHDLTNGLVGANLATGYGAVQYGVSLGNDVGYGIDSDGKLYAWGDNAYGQLAKDKTIKNSLTPSEIGNIGTIVSVAAGKQKSGSVKAFNSYDTLNAENNGWGDNVKNAEEFITGAINSDGALYVWSNKNSTPTPITFGNAATVNESDKFVAVYSGYGNNLFAVTKVGKLVRITVAVNEDKSFKAYSQYIYDSFLNADGTSITNWTVNNNNNANAVINTVELKPTADPTRDNPAPGFNAVTFYVWNATPENSTNTEIFNGTGGAYKTLVKDNNIGDVYRILTEDKTFLKAENPSGGHDFAPKYYYERVNADNLMDPMQQENMFHADIVNNENGTGIQITPKQSSHGKEITVVFYVARYNHAANYSMGSDNAINDTALYYDYKECRISFTIADTPTVVNYSAYGADGNSNIPLLDPNNQYNTYYSLAVQNVSGGVAALLDYITKDQAQTNADALTIFNNKAIVAMNEKDLGFPAKSKIVPGKLDYYLNEHADSADNKYYIDSYKYLFNDRDADRVVVNTLNLQAIGMTDSVVPVSGTIEHISVEIDLGDLVLNSKNVSALAKCFNNNYGLYDIKVDTENKILAFTYDVLQIKAIDATGTVGYVNNSNNIYDYLTTYARPRVMININSIATFATRFDTENDRNFATYPTANSPMIVGKVDDVCEISNQGRVVQRIVGVYSQPSLRLKLNFATGEGDNKEEIFGSSGAGANNKLTIDYCNLFNKRLYVGSTETIELSTFVGLDEKTGKLNDTIRFSYGNAATDFSGFNKQFIDETGGNLPVVDLSGTQLKISPTTGEPINLTVTVQRFKTNSYISTNTFGENEKVYITFIFNQITDFTLTPVNSSKDFIINQPSVINVFGKDVDPTAINGPYISISGVDAPSIAALSNLVRIVGIQTSEDNKSVGKLFTFSEPEGGKFTITPLASGSGSIQFVATVYGKTVFISLELSISSTTTLTDTVVIVDDQYLYVSDIKNKLDQANSFNGKNDMSAYKILYNDVQNPEAARIDRVYNAIEFKTADGTAVNPTFIKNVVFEDVDINPSIRIVSANTATPGTETYYMHVTFVKGNAATYAEAQEADKLVVRIPVRSGKSVITQHMVSIDCKNPVVNEFISYNGTSGVNTEAIINISYLLTSIDVEGAPNYNVFLVSSDSETSDYFNYAPSANKKNVVITPLYNTPRDENNAPIAREVNVSVSNGSAFLVISFGVTVDGILTVLPASTTGGTIGYGQIWLYSFLIVFGVLAIIFIIRLIVYWKKRAKQRAIIKRNQELIRMRDRMHNKANAASKEQIVRTKLKMEDPKYAKIFNDMRKNKEEESGITLENSDLAATADSKVKKNKKKKKGGKKTVAELKAELEAKKAAFAAAQANAQPVNPFDAGMPMDGAEFVAPDAGYDAQDGFVAQDAYADPAGDFATPDMDGGEIIFDATDLGDGM